jgi:S-adenosylmethionine/arginine decarboxylase-like enzyme
VQPYPHKELGSCTNYGLELIIDLKGCDLTGLTQKLLSRFFIELCDRICMTRHGDPIFWEDWSDIPHLHGVSAIQFIETSNVVCHALPMLRAVYLNVFSCKEFDAEDALAFCKKFWGATSTVHTVIART